MEQFKFDFNTAEKKAKNALVATKKYQIDLIQKLDTFRQCISTNTIETATNLSQESKQIIESYTKDYNDLQNMLTNDLEQESRSLKEKYKELEANARFVTIMLFGRTKAGKSTTMEALTSGDGQSIGKGGQHTTTEVKAYYFPPSSQKDIIPNYPCLRIVDTPGIEGFNGKELAKKAEDYVINSDHIFFLLSDDKAGSEELEKFNYITTQGKDVTVLLNVKSKSEDFDLLIKTPERTFNKETLKETKQRIVNYLAKHFDIPEPTIIPFHAQAAWESRNNKSNLTVNSYELYKASKFSDIKNFIHKEVLKKANYTRSKSPRDALNKYVYPLKEELSEYKKKFKTDKNNIIILIRNLKQGIEKAREKSFKRLDLLQNRIKEASNDIDYFVTDIIDNKHKRHGIEKQSKEFLEKHNIANIQDCFTGYAKSVFEKEIAEQVELAKQESEKNNLDDDTFSSYYKEEDSKNYNKYWRIGLKTVVTSGSTFAIENIWNPVGWVAATAMVATATISNFVSDSWEKSDQTDSRNRKEKLINERRNELWKYYKNEKKACKEWLKDTSLKYIDFIDKSYIPVLKNVKFLDTQLKELLDSLDTIANQSNQELIIELLYGLIPEVANQSIKIEKVVRSPMNAVKILVSCEDITINPLGLCIGKNGIRCKELSKMLGYERIYFINNNSSKEQQLQQALGDKNLQTTDIYIAEQVNKDIKEKETIATLIIPKNNIGKIIGKKGVNINLTSELLNIKIEIKERI